MKNYVFLLILLFGFFESDGQQTWLNGGNYCEEQTYNLVLEDNFDGSLDESKWYTYFPYGEGNSDQCEFCRTHDFLPDDPSEDFGEGQIYLDENVRTEGGKLIFDIKKEPADWFGQFKNYTSGMIHSKKFFGYGKYEIRCKIPYGYAHFPAFWIQDGNHEIDVFESWGPPDNGPTKKVLCSVHNYNIATSDFWVNEGIDYTADFHTYTVIYGKNLTYFYVDDVLKGIVSRFYTLAGHPVEECNLAPGYYFINEAYPPVNKHFRVIANAAVVGGPAGNNQVPEATMEVDYIRVYEFDTCVDTEFACEEGTNNPIVIINQDTEWGECDTKNIADQFQYITVKDNSTLKMLNCDIKMLLPGKIVVESGSTLLLENTTIRPCSEDYRWHGIYLEEGANIKLKNNSSLKTSYFGIYNNPDLPNYVASDGTISTYGLIHNMPESGGNNSVILNNSSLLNNYIGIAIDGNDNTISLTPQNTIEGSNIATIVRGNIDGYFEYKNVTFLNNDISLKAKNCGDRHVIYNCEFVNTNNITTQITLENVEGLDFQLNKMDGPGYQFDASDSHVDILNKNEFLNSKLALWIGGTYPLASSARIGDLNGEANYFSGNVNGIKLSGINSAVGGLVQNNQIENTNKIAIDVDGISLSNISNNTIDNAEDGVYFSKTGELESFINCNRFKNNGIQDLTIELTNNKTLFLQNDFSGSQNEGNIVLIQARVKNIQGSENNPSDNCFDLNAVDDLYTDPATIEFQYHHNKIIQCKIPSGNGEYQAKDSDDEGDNCPNDQIGSNFVGSTTPPVAITPIPLPPRLTPHPPGIIGPNIDTTLTDLVNTGGDDPYTYIDESLPNTEILPNVVYPPAYLANMQAIYNYESELDYWIRVGVQYAIDNNDYTYGEDLLLPLKKWRWQEMLFGLYVKSDQFTKARELLNVLPNNTAYEMAFIDLQHINLDRLINGDQSITPTQIQTVYTIATGTTPAVGYAIPIYYHLTGIRLTSSVPTKNGGTRNSQDVNIGNGLSIVPNPAMDELTLKNKFDRKLNDIMIIDRNFQVKIKLTADNLDRINISNLVSGLYMIRCVVDDKELVTLPFVKL